MTEMLYCLPSRLVSLIQKYQNGLSWVSVGWVGNGSVGLWVEMFVV